MLLFLDALKSSKFYQWNRKTAWPVTGEITGWSDTYSEGYTWEKTNDPSPEGWRVPTREELQKLLDIDSVTSEWITLNGIDGRIFTDNTSGNSLFLPAVGYRYGKNGTVIVADLLGCCWSSTLSDNTYFGAFYLNFSNGYAGWGYCNGDGYSIRAVANSQP